MAGRSPLSDLGAMRSSMAAVQAEPCEGMTGSHSSEMDTRWDMETAGKMERPMRHC